MVKGHVPAEIVWSVSRSRAWMSYILLQRRARLNGHDHLHSRSAMSLLVMSSTVLLMIPRPNEAATLTLTVARCRSRQTLASLSSSQQGQSLTVSFACEKCCTRGDGVNGCDRPLWQHQYEKALVSKYTDIQVVYDWSCSTGSSQSVGRICRFAHVMR